MPNMRLQCRQRATYGRQRKSPEKTADAFSGEVCPNFLSGNLLDTTYNLHISVKAIQMLSNASDYRHSEISDMCCLSHCQQSDTEIQANSSENFIVTHVSKHYRAPHRTSRSSSTYRSNHTNLASSTSRSHSPRNRIGKAAPITFIRQSYRTAAACDAVNTITPAWRIK